MSATLTADGRHGPAPIERRELLVGAVRKVGPYAILSVADSGPAPAPGQFYMLSTAAGWGGERDGRPYLPRAISVMDCAEGRIDFMLDAVGPGTSELCALDEGDGILVLGPLGRGFRPGQGARPVICAGGIGVAPMVGLARALGSEAEILLGFRDRAHAEAVTLFERAAVATDDGSEGARGSAVDLLAQTLERDPVAVVYSCGPPAMLEAVRNLCLEAGVPAQLALESGMACGFGACYGCVVATRDEGYVRLCVDGPVLDGDRLADGWEAAYG